MHFTSEEKRLLYNKWLRPVTSEELRNGVALLFGILQETGIELCLTDASNSNSPTREDKERIIAVISHLISSNKCPFRRMALVKPRDVFSDVIAEDIREQVGYLSGSTVSMQWFDCLPEAYEWLLSPETHTTTVDSFQ